MQEYFYTLSEAALAQLQPPEVLTCSFRGEHSDFVRFNRSNIRQAGTVEQRVLTLELIVDQRHATAALSLGGDVEADCRRITQALSALRQQFPHLAEDPHLLYATTVHNSVQQDVNRLPARDDVVAAILRAGQGRDLVGIYAAGGIYTGFANSFGQRNWHETYPFNFDWSFYYQDDKAVKTTYAGWQWEPEAFADKVDLANAQLAQLHHSPRTIPPGRYRAYLAPAAVSELLDMLAWGGFGLKAHRTKQTPLLKLAAEEVFLHPAITIRENTGEGVSPNFQAAGFLRQSLVPLIVGGKYQDCLISPRSAQEYGVATNGAGHTESPQSLDMAAGQLAPQDVLQNLDTGVYINNLWYLNYSERASCRITGMTRFATFWVERGAIQGPLNVMRFDDSVYRLFGDALVGLTSERDFILDSGTYGQRSTRSSRVPGALVADLTFTL